MTTHHAFSFEKPFAFDATNDLDAVVLVHALLEAELTALPLNPRLALDERNRLCKFADAQLLERADGGWSVAQTSLNEASRDDATATRLATSTPTSRPTVLISTSGSTGTPKLVCLSRRALEASARANAEHLAMTSADKWLLSLNLAHIGGYSVVTRCLYSGATLVLARSGLGVEEMIDRVCAEKLTLLSLVPTQLQRIVALPHLPDLSSLRAVLVGGASCPSRLLNEARRRGLPALATYGLSESAAQVTTQPLSDLNGHDASIDSGIALGQTELRIVDGVLQLRGPTLFDGYYCPVSPTMMQSEKTADGFFSTGDLGYLTPEGRFVAEGRRQDRIVTGGENVSPLEVENALRLLPEISDVAVVGLDDDDWGQVVAAAVVRSDGRIDCGPEWFDELKTLLRLQLASYKCPKRWCCLTELPRLPSGKLARPSIAKHFAP
jgi:O-succinylbenzoic acid--CoA ligase